MVGQRWGDGCFAHAAKPPQGPATSSWAAPCSGAAPAHARDHHSKRERDGWHWGRAQRVGGGGTWGGENQLPPCLVCLKVGFCWKMAAACAAQGADPGHRCRPAPRHQRHLVPRAPRTAGPNLYLHKGVRGASRGRGLGLRGGGATGRPLLGWQFTKKWYLSAVATGCGGCSHARLPRVTGFTKPTRGKHHACST
jgi:hypothetical protein